MGYKASIFSLMFFLACCVYLFWGIYIIRSNPKSNINKVFLFLCFLLSIWSFAFSIANSAANVEICLFWRRIAAIGWTSVYSVILHFIVLLIHKKEKLERKRVFLLLYIPAIINIYVFSFSNSMVAIQYNLIETDYGWANISINNGYDWFFYLYYISFIIASLALVWKWKQRLQDKKIIKQANLIIMTILISLLLGSFTDVVLNASFAKPLPQMAPIFILIPIWAMYHSARYYDVFKVETVKKKEIIVTKEQQKRIFTNLSIAICISGILAFISEYFSNIHENRGDLKAALIMGGSLIIIGLSILFIQRIRKKSLKGALTTGVLVSSIPIVGFMFLKYSMVTVWVFPIIIMLSSLLFNNRTMLISTTIVAIITQRLVWILRPDSYVLVDEYDYIARIIIIIATFFIGSYINKIYIAKIKENAYQIAFQKLDSEISFDFVTLNQENFDDKVNNLLARIGTFFQVDRTYLFTINHQNSTMTYSNEWCNTGIDPEVGTIDEVPLEVFPWWIEQLKENRLVYIEDVDNMPKEASSEQEQLLRQKVKSLVSVPIECGDGIQAFIGMDSVLKHKKWSDENIKLLNIMANLLASGLMQMKSAKKIEFMAYNDHLTKLPNRFLFADRVNQAINSSKRTGEFVSVIFIDLDGFKAVNDTIGHKGGDILLKEIACRLTKVLRKTDTVARFGGDEFMIMLNNITDHSTITKIADKIMKLFSEIFSINGQEFLVTASAGISIYPVDGEDSEALVKNADIAMYKAKSKGKNQYALCTEDMKEELQISMELSNDLYRALERNELMVYYQPQVDLITKEISGVEALVRWMHPRKGMISPGVFIALAEKNGLINNVGEWVLRTACIQNKKWQDMGIPHMQMAVNLSAIQIINPKIAENIESILKETGLDPKNLELEITESVAIKETNYALDVLNKLKKIGVAIAIDDFGTEYSSLNRLKMLPVDRIKIDMQFVQGIESNEKDKAITMVIINLAKSLGLNVLAEGVETEAQLEFLNQKMCDNVQGYYYYKPMPAEEMEKILIELKEGTGDKSFKQPKMKLVTQNS